MREDITKYYRIYLKDGTTIDCVNISEKDDKYILSLPSETRNLSFDEVDMISFINTNNVCGCILDSMALGLEPHKLEAMLRYIKRRFKVAE